MRPPALSASAAAATTSTLLTLLILSAWLPTASAGYMGDLVYGACDLSYWHVHFDDLGPSPSKLRERCLSRLRVESFYLCLKTYSPPDVTTWLEPLASQNETCQRYLNESMLPFDIVAHYSDEDVAKLHHLSVEEGSAGLLSSELLVPSEDLYQHAYDTLVGPQTYMSHSHD